MCQPQRVMCHGVLTFRRSIWWPFFQKTCPTVKQGVMKSLPPHFQILSDIFKSFPPDLHATVILPIHWNSVYSWQTILQSLRVTLLMYYLPLVLMAQKGEQGPIWSVAPSWILPVPWRTTSCRQACLHRWYQLGGKPRSAGPPGRQPARAATTSHSLHSGCPATSELLL